MAGATRNFPENQKVFCNKEVFEKKSKVLRQLLRGGMGRRLPVPVLSGIGLLRPFFRDAE